MPEIERGDSAASHKLHSFFPDAPANVMHMEGKNTTASPTGRHQGPLTDKTSSSSRLSKVDPVDELMISYLISQSLPQIVASRKAQALQCTSELAARSTSGFMKGSTAGLQKSQARPPANVEGNMGQYIAAGKGFSGVRVMKAPVNNFSQHVLFERYSPRHDQIPLPNGVPQTVLDHLHELSHTGSGGRRRLIDRIVAAQEQHHATSVSTSKKLQELLDRMLGGVGTNAPSVERSHVESEGSKGLTDPVLDAAFCDAILSDLEAMAEVDAAALQAHMNVNLPDIMTSTEGIPSV